MKLVSLEVTGFRKLTAVELDVKGNIVEISGRNAAGKSSLIDAPWVLLKGLDQKKSVRPVPTQPIHTGMEQAIIKGTFKGKDVGLIATRTFKTSANNPKGWTSKLEVTNLEGLTSRTPPQAQLDAIIGEHRLDPIEFINLNEKEQLDAFRVFIPDVDFEAIEELNAIDYAKRTEVGQTVKRLKGAAEAIVVPPDTPAEEVDVNALATELSKAGEHNTQIETRKAKRREVAANVAHFRKSETDTIARIAALEEQIAELKILKDISKKQADELQAKLDNAPALPAPTDTDEITAKIQAANQTNIAVRQRIEKQKHAEDAAAAQTEYDALTTVMDQRKANMEAAIKSAKLPLPNIGFGKNGLLLNGLPFKEASTAEQIRTAVALAMSLHPQLKLMWIRDASLLDDDMLAEIYRLAEQYDCTVLLETVRPQSAGAVILEDGHVKGDESNDEARGQPMTATEVLSRQMPVMTDAERKRLDDGYAAICPPDKDDVPSTTDDDIL